MKPLLFARKTISFLERPILHTVLTRIASTVFNFLIALLIARHAGPAVKGEVTLLITTIWFFIFFSNIRGGQVLVYLIPRNKLELLVVPAYIWSCLIAAGGFLILRFTPLVQAEHITSVVVLSFLSALLSIHHTILLARKQITNANLLQIIPLILQVAGVIFCFYFLRIENAYAYIYASLAAYAIAVPLSFFLVRKLIRFREIFSDLSIRDLKTSFRFGLLYQFVEVLQLLHLRYYFYQLGLQQGAQYLGVFSIGISILETVWIIPRSISTVHYVSTSNSSEITNEVNRTVQLVKTSIVLCALTILLIAAIPSFAYTFIFGPGFSDVKHSMRFLYPGVFIYSIPIVISSFYFGIGRYREPLLAHLCGLITLIVFSYFLIPTYVMSGAGLAATLSFGVSSLLLFMYFVMDNELHISQFLIQKEDLLLIRNKIRGWMKTR